MAEPSARDSRPAGPTRSLVEPRSEFVFWIDDDGVVRDIDEALAGLLDVDRAAVVGRPLSELSWFSAADVARLIASVGPSPRASTAGLHVCLATPSGTRALELCAYSTAGCTVCIARDPGPHAQQLRMYSVLRYSLERTEYELRCLAEGSPDLILRIGLDGRLDYRNRDVAEYLGTNDHAAESELLAQLAPLFHLAVAAPRTLDLELPLTDRTRALEVRVVPDVHHAPQPARLVVVRDVTEARQAAHQQREGQRMELVGRLAGGVAHDFNNLLTAMLIQVGFLDGEVGLSPAAHETCADLRATVRRATELVRQILTFSRCKPASPAEVAVGPRLRDLSRLMGHLLGTGVRLDLDLPAELPHVKVDPVMFEQVVMNLALNARDAMSGRGRLGIAAMVVDGAAPGAERANAARRFVRVDVCDEGVGIPADVLPHIFEPFFTTKDSGRGTGLGLATVQAIVHQHGGCVAVDSVVGRGTTFHVYLPVVEAQAPRTASGEEHLLASAASEVVLLVEPEDRLRHSSRAALERLGYAVLDARAAPEAERVWRDVNGNVRVLVVDAVMPGVSGRELVASLRAVRPRLRVVYLVPCEPTLAASLGLGPRTRALTKPFDARQLAAAVRAALDEA